MEQFKKIKRAGTIVGGLLAFLILIIIEKMPPHLVGPSITLVAILMVILVFVLGR